MTKNKKSPRFSLKMQAEDILSSYWVKGRKGENKFSLLLCYSHCRNHEKQAFLWFFEVLIVNNTLRGFVCLRLNREQYCPLLNSSLCNVRAFGQSLRQVRDVFPCFSTWTKDPLGINYESVEYRVWEDGLGVRQTWVPVSILPMIQGM